MMTDLTKGKPGQVLFKFTMPLFISVIFQQLYNIADSVIAGQFAGEEALAAVGASYQVTMLFMAIALGSGIGVNVLAARLFGEKNFKALKEAVYTALFSCLGISIVLTALGFIFTNPILRVIHTPENIFKDSAIYLQIYIAGFLFLYIYNVCNGIFSGLGDSKTPLYFLMGSSIGNIVLDYIFVAIYGQGVAGVAIATFIAQGIAAILAVWTILYRIGGIEVGENVALFSMAALKDIAFIAIPSILQNSFVAVGNLLVQSLVNSFGSSVIAGYSAAIKLNTFMLTCIMTVGSACSSFTAQNIGAKQFDRVRDGAKAAFKMSITTVLLFTILYAIKPELSLSLFLKEYGEAMQTGMDFLRIAGFAYIIIGIKVVADGTLRGAADMKGFMISTFVDLVLRVILSYIFAYFFGSIGIWMSWPIGWFIGAALAYGYYKRLLQSLKQ